MILYYNTTLFLHKVSTMNLMIKVLIFSLFLSFISCKLYEAVDKSLIKDNKRSGRKARSISYKEVNNQEQNNENNLKEAKESKKTII